ncbi:unnamed protein product, partial [Brenthis ino]
MVPTVVCVLALFAKIITGQCIGAGYYGNNVISSAAEAAYANNLAQAGVIVPEIGTAFNGGGFQVTSYSPIAPTGITVRADNLVIEGSLAVSGQMPFLGVVAVEGPLPAVGQGSVAYGCGNGNVGIVSEGVENIVPEYASGRGLAAALNGVGCANGGYGPTY